MSNLKTGRNAHRTTDRPADPVGAAVRDIESASPAPVEVPVKAVTQRPVTPMHTVNDGRGAFRFVKTGDHIGSYEWDASAKAIEPLQLPLGSDTVGQMFHLARHHGLDANAFLAWCHEHRDEVRAAGRAFRLDGGQLTAYDAIVTAFRTASA